MQKSVTLCEELGCPREWTTVVEQSGQPLMAPQSSTVMKIKVCDPCAEKLQKYAVAARGSTMKSMPMDSTKATPMGPG